MAISNFARKTIGAIAVTLGAAGVIAAPVGAVMLLFGALSQGLGLLVIGGICLFAAYVLTD